MIPVLLNYVDENIALSLEAALLKKPPGKWKWDWWKSHRVTGSGIDEKITLWVEAGLLKNHSVSWSGSDEKITV